jgi:ferredoxin
MTPRRNQQLIGVIHHLIIQQRPTHEQKNFHEKELKHMSKRKDGSKTDVFQLLLETSDKQRKDKRTQLLETLKVKEFFEDGSISINTRTCQGLECELCIKACPTNALYWRDGKVAVIDDLCVYCGACVLCCIVDDCIKVIRKRKDGRQECFSKPWEVIMLCNTVNNQRRHKRVESLFPAQEDYLKRYGKLR